MKTITALAIAITLVLGNTAKADTINVTYDNPVWTPLSYDALRFSLDSGNTWSGSVGASRYQATINSFTGSLNGLAFVDNVNDLFIYCYDLLQYINHGQTLTYNVDYTGVQARTLDYLGAVDYVLNGSTNTWADPFAWLHPAPISIGNQNLTATNVAAGIQLGIWESLYDTGTWDLAGGTFRATDVDAGTLAAFTAFTGALAAGDSVAQNRTMLLRSDTAQDQITGLRPPTGNLRTVPEPGTLVLAGIAIAGLAGARRRG